MPAVAPARRSPAPGAVLQAAAEATRLSEAEFAARVGRLAWRSRADGGAGLRAEAFGLISEAVRRATGLTPFPVQLAGGWTMASGRLAEMQTGEGKTLTATFPAAWFAFAGRGCHVLTDNDYLAKRDAEELAPVFGLLGLTVGCVVADLSDDERREAYAKDITYATVQECGFDFLRDRLRLGVEADDPRVATSDGAGRVQRPLWAAVVDEADSILLDSARTPLIIAAQTPVDGRDEALARWADDVATKLEAGPDYFADPIHRRVTLTLDGCRRASLSRPPFGAAAERRYELIETALNARLFHLRDRDYVVTPDDEIGIIDVGTGRQKEGSRWQHGLHRAIEIKEGVPLAGEAASTASITVQRYLRGYRKLCGMTGTSRPSAGEIRKTYGLKTVVIPTNRPCIRRGLPTRVFATADGKYAAIAEECRAMIDAGRSVLIGTPSIEISERVAAELQRGGIDSQLLHARRRDLEADIVAEAGQPGRVTVATNMAGRGTDIRLADSVRDSGGLHVIATEMHHSRRIDRQLIGRAARQGDPGSYRFLLSLDDELIESLPAKRRERLRRSVAGKSDLPVDRWAPLFRRIQRRVDAKHKRERAAAARAERRSRASLRRMGLCPYLEAAAE